MQMNTIWITITKTWNMISRNKTAVITRTEVTDTRREALDILNMAITSVAEKFILMANLCTRNSTDTTNITKRKFIMNPKPRSKLASCYSQLNLNQIFFHSHIHYEEPKHIHTVHHHHIQKYTVIKKIPYEVIKEIKVPYKVYVFEKVPYKYYVKPLIVKVPIDYVSSVTTRRTWGLKSKSISVPHQRRETRAPRRRTWRGRAWVRRARGQLWWRRSNSPSAPSWVKRENPKSFRAK